MPDDTTTYPQPPQPTVVPGTGSAVQTAKDQAGHKWQYDDEGKNWVNLDTGEAVSPEVFSQMAGRSGSAARDTMALAEAMRREEASLVAPRAPTPVAQPQAPSPMPAPMTGTSPVLPPGGAAVRPPSQFYSPEQVSRVAGQRAVPSTRLPPTDAAMTFYKQQQIQSLVNQGWKPADALKLVGIGQAPMMTPYQQATVAEKKRQFDVLHPAGGTPMAEPVITDLGKVGKIVRIPGSNRWQLVDREDKPKQFTPEQAASLLTKITKEEQDSGSSALSGMKDDLAQIAKAGVPSKGIAAPAPKTGDRVKVIGPGGKTGTVPKGTPLPAGWKLAP